MPENQPAGSGDAWEEATDDVSAESPARPAAASPEVSGAEVSGAEVSGAENNGAEKSSTDKTEGETTAPDAGIPGAGAPDDRMGEGPAGSAAETTEGEPTGGADREGAEPAADYTDPRQVLDAVAAGRLSPGEAAALLDTFQAEPGPDQASAGPSAASSASSAPQASGARGDQQVEVKVKPTRLRIRAVGRRVKIVGEPFVDTVSVDGPHVIRQEGDTLQITSEGEFGASLDGFTLTPPRSLRDVQQKVMDLGRELSIRVNPALAIEAEVTAGSVNVERAPLLEQLRLTAGSARVRDVEGPIDVLVQAGSAQVEGRIGKGRSRLRVESGSLQLRLLQGSSVRIRPDAQLGRVQWEPARPGKESDERVIGVGDARLDLEVMMGAVTVKEAP